MNQNARRNSEIFCVGVFSVSKELDIGGFLVLSVLIGVYGVINCQLIIKKKNS